MRDRAPPPYRAPAAAPSVEARLAFTYYDLAWICLDFATIWFDFGWLVVSFRLDLA